MNAKDVRESNQNWKAIYLKDLSLKRKEKLNELLDSRNEFIHLKDEEKFNFLVGHIFELSLSKDEKVISVLDSMGVDKIVTKFFVDANKVFEELDQLYEDSIFLYPYELIWKYYEGLSILFFSKQLAVQYKLELDKVLDKLTRREKKSTLKESEKEEMDKLKKVDQKVKQEHLDLRILIKKGNVSSTIRKSYNKPHKILLYNFFMTYKEFNLASPIGKKDMTSFYSMFFKLMKILSRDIKYLNDKKEEDILVDYATVELFHAKRVKSLLKLKGYGSYD